MNIPFVSFKPMHQPLKNEMVEAFGKFVDDSWFVLGDGVKEFESAYAQFNQVKYAVGISNGLDALHIALKTLKIGAGDEVIVPSNTYIATVLACTYVGATPVLVEPDIRTYNIDVEKIEAAITPKTKAIMPVHLYGQACEMEKIMAIAAKHNLYVIEDNAQSQGAAFKGQLTGTMGQINGTSFYPGKNLGALGDAGAITTNDEALAKEAMMLRNYGSSKKYHNEVVGFNMRLDELQARLLSIKLKNLDVWTAQRQTIAAQYADLLSGVNDLILPYTHTDATHVYHLYVVRTTRRDALAAHLQEKGIATLIHYPIPPHLQKAYAHLQIKEGTLPIAEELANTCLSLPMYPGLSAEEVAYVSQQVRAFFE